MGENYDSEVRWQRSPTQEDAANKYRLVRTPSKGALVVRILSHEFTGARTHYYGGRTSPCNPKSCKACDENLASRWHGWLFCQDLKTLEIQIVEFPPSVGESLDRKFSQLRTLRGVHMKLHRIGGKPNGRVVVQFGDQDQDREALPKVPALEGILCSIWGLRKAQTTRSPRMTDHEAERLGDVEGQETFLREHD